MSQVIRGSGPVKYKEATDTDGGGSTHGVRPNAPMSGAEARSAEASAPLAGWASLGEAPVGLY